MANDQWSISLDTRKLDRLMREEPERTARVINKATIDVQADAEANTARVDTGAMKNGWAVNLIGGDSSVNKKSMRVGSLNPRGHSVSLPQAGRTYSVVGNIMEYAYLWEVGHAGFAPEAMLSRAIEKNRQPFYDGFGALCEL